MPVVKISQVVLTNNLNGASSLSSHWNLYSLHRLSLLFCWIPSITSWVWGSGRGSVYLWWMYPLWSRNNNKITFSAFSTHSFINCLCRLTTVVSISPKPLDTNQRKLLCVHITQDCESDTGLRSWVYEINQNWESIIAWSIWIAPSFNDISSKFGSTSSVFFSWHPTPSPPKHSTPFWISRKTCVYTRASESVWKCECFTRMLLTWVSVLDVAFSNPFGSSISC